MKSIILVCALCLHLSGSYGSDDSDGVGAFAYQDSSGNRYGGTYGLRDGQVVNQEGNFPPNFSPPAFSPPNFLDFPDEFFPEYFNNLGNLLQEAFIRPPPFFRPPPFRRQIPFSKRTFENRVDDQTLAFDAARKAYDLTSNRAGYNPHFTPSRFSGENFPGFGGFPGPQGFPGFQMPNFRRNFDNSAYAGAAVGPGFNRQIARISPANPDMPNIDKFSSGSNAPGGGFKTSSTYAVSTSQNVNGQKIETRRAGTKVNDNGVITEYNVQS